MIRMHKNVINCKILLMRSLPVLFFLSAGVCLRAEEKVIVAKQNPDGQAVRNPLPERSKPLCFATTIDFLDYVFFKGKGDIYTLEEYEEVMKGLAECGIKKVYLRVHGSGLPLYPSKVTDQYGTGDAWHWRTRELSERLIKTIRTYDVCTETIRLAHKYGMEAWAWDAFFDNGLTYYALESRAHREDPELMKIAQRNDFIPMLDPVMRKNLNLYAMADPRFVPFPEEKKTINQSVKGAKIGKIVMPGVKRSKINLRKEDVEIYYTNDNFNYSYVRYDKPFSITLDKTPDGRNRLTLDKLNIDGRFVKLVHKTRYEHNGYGFSTKSREGESRVYDTNGKLLHTVWAGAGKNLGTPLDFTRVRTSLRFDYSDSQIGFVVGEPEDEKTRYFLGVAELAVPAAMEHKVARFAELAKYPFDGFMLNWRSHSSVQDPLRYGFNPEVREKFLQRHGKDIWRDSFAIADLLQLRAEAVAEFYKRCKALTGGRPLYATGYAPATPGELPRREIRSMGDDKTAYMPMLYPRYFADGSLDGIMMAGTDFSETLAQYRSGGKPIKIGAFRELATGYYFTGKYDFAEDMEKLYSNPRLDEIELYEALLLTERPAARAVIKRLSSPNPLEANAGSRTETHTEK